MLRATAVKRAPIKAPLLQQTIMNNTFGIQWNKVTWGAPHNNAYPFSAGAGFASKYLSNPLTFGSPQGRMSRMWVRQAVLLSPTVLCAAIMLFQLEPYDLVYCVHFLTGLDIPKAIQDRYDDQIARMPREKPGVLLKHLYGGQVSIPGSDRLITGE